MIFHLWNSFVAPPDFYLYCSPWLEASLVITIRAILCVFVCLFLFDWAGWVFAAISSVMWTCCTFTEDSHNTKNFMPSSAQNLCQISYCCVLQSKGFLFKWSSRQIAFCRQTQSGYTVPILVPKEQISLQDFTGDWAIHRQGKLLAAGRKGKPCSLRLYLERNKVSSPMSPLSFYSS